MRPDYSSFKLLHMYSNSLCTTLAVPDDPGVSGGQVRRRGTGGAATGTAAPLLLAGLVETGQGSLRGVEEGGGGGCQPS